ncbi:hypothetical protein [Vulgatibacter sp.]|uniref:hypothetical protein n=1 Tax=Vulgatibacter sp. TaxID=1971226 RepID=UPI0035626658
MPQLKPITFPGSAQRPLRYAVRDPIGVESVGAPEPLGINRNLAWLRDVYDVTTAEHATSGHHDTPKIARAMLVLRWDAGEMEYVVDPGSYLLGTVGASVATITSSIGSPGVIEVTLSQALGSTRLGIAGASLWAPITAFDGSAAKLIRVCKASVTTTTKLAVNRYEGTTAAGLALAHGDCAFLVYEG